MADPFCKEGYMMEISQWRSPNDCSFFARALSDPYWDKDRQCKVVDVESDTGYAVWDEENKQWEDGEY